MFTDTEVGLILRHRRDVDTVVSNAQRIVDRQAVQIANLRFALEAQRSVNAQMKSDLGSRAVDDIMMIRALKRRAAAH